MSADRRRAHLRAMLDGFSPFDEREAEHLRRMRKLIAAAGDPFSRAHFDPGHFTASSFVLCPHRQSLLLILHGKLHRWLQPGGHVDRVDADIEAAARREVLEEVGLGEVTLERPGVFDVDIHPIAARGGEPGHEHFDVRFLYRAAHMSVAAASDARQVRWMPLDQVNGELSDESVLRAVRKLRG